MSETVFDHVLQAHDWHPIRECPGRWTLGGGRHAEPGELDVPEDVESVEVPDPPTRDPLHLTPFPGGGGLISYEKRDGRLLHTLCNAEGWRRKLEEVGLDPDEWTAQ